MVKAGNCISTRFCMLALLALVLGADWAVSCIENAGMQTCFNQPNPEMKLSIIRI